MDIVVVIRTLSPRNHASVLQQLEQIIKSASQTCQNVQRTPFSVQFDCYVVKNMKVKVDLLPGGVMPEGPVVFFLSLPNSEERQLMSASSSSLQSQFIASQSELFKDLVRVAKQCNSKHLNYCT